MKILAKAKQAVNVCKAHACLRFLFISLRACAPWCLLLSLHMEASPKDDSQTEHPTETNPTLFQSSAVAGNGVIFLFCSLLLASSISALLHVAKARFCCCLLLEARNSCADENKLLLSFSSVCGLQCVAPSGHGFKQTVIASYLLRNTSP